MAYSNRVLFHTVVLLVATWAAPGVTAAEPSKTPLTTAECEQLWAHVDQLMDQNPGAKALLDRRTEEGEAAERKKFMTDCATTAPAQIAILRCVQGIEKFEDMERCMEPPPEEPVDLGKLAEAEANLQAIRIAQKTNMAMEDTYVACPHTPEAIPGVEPAPFEGGGRAQFDAVVFSPGGPVYCRYSVTLTEDEFGKPDFEARAECDTDGDGVPAIWAATNHGPPAAVTGADVR